MNDVLFELGSEELPSGAVFPLANALADNLVAALFKANLTHGEVTRFATPRRLAVLIQDVQMEQSTQSLSRRGPNASLASDAPAVVGFARSCGVNVDQLTHTTTDKGSWWGYESIKPGAHLRDLLPAMVNHAVATLPIAKPMRWGAGDTQFVRPVHWAVLLLGTEVVCTEVLGVKTDRYTRGHRYHHPEPIAIDSPRLYESLLKKASVIASFDVRRQAIVDQVQQWATHQDSVPVIPNDLLDEVTSIVEWPQALLAHFDSSFLDVPAEALIAAMQSHQKCFALRDNQGQLLPQFITVANIASKDPQRVIMGNESVMRARLSDAAFFFRQDKKKPLSDYYASTTQVIFQQKLGSLADKSKRLQQLMVNLSEVLGLESSEASRAAELSKCDLMTGMVGEFPELQGLMGYYYAKNDREVDAVAIALNEQYMPRFAADQLPPSPLGRALSLTDRIDTLVGAFAIGQKPTGDKDPFKLRRHALAVVRLLATTPVPLTLSRLIDQSHQIYGPDLQDADQRLLELRPFILDRLQSYYQTQGISVDIVQAARACQDEWLFDLDRRVHALLAFIQLPNATALAAACKRVNNLLSQAPEYASNQSVDSTLLNESAELTLFECLSAVEAAINVPEHANDYVFILTQLASLRVPLDVFFEQVMVMVENPALRDNRLRLLARLQALLQSVADISLLEVTSLLN